jgi:hypothetical protein
MIPRALTLLFCATTLAQSPAPLPANYKTILDNPDVLVMRVHYGPHEFVPMHDHSAYPTVYVYLNDSGEVRIDHEPPNAFSVTRPPTHTGAFRIAPGMTERHSITNLSDLPSDFLRVELKRIPPTAIKDVFRGEAPRPPYRSHSETLYDKPALRIVRDVCVLAEMCTPETAKAPSVVVAMPLHLPSAPKKDPVLWVPANKDPYAIKDVQAMEDHDYQVLRIILPTH